MTVLTLVALLAAACGSGDGDPTASADAATLLAGTASINAARSFNDSGFHEIVGINATIPESLDLSESGVSTITVSLWDASRPGQTCGRNHPLSGCLTIDWSDSPGRPGVPESGVFENQLTLELTSGRTTYHLSETGSLNGVPDPFSPG